MKKLELDSSKESFVRGWYIEESICDDIIDFFNSDLYFPIKRGTAGNYVDLNVKNSFDKSISSVTQEPRLLKYFDALSAVVNLYKEEFVWCNNTQDWRIVENVNIQHYPIDGGFKIFHTERDGKLHSISRHLVFMTYLNTVNDGGETEFYYQKLKIKPEKGLTLIWPTDWTHTHRGIPSKTEEKTIITGWYSFV